MTDFQINDHLLSKECDALAKDIFDETMAEHSDSEPEDLREDMFDRAHETADGHAWVIYNYQALMLCTHCDTSNGDQFLEDVGMPEDPTLHKIACFIAYGEIRARIEQEIERLIEEYDEAHP